MSKVKMFDFKRFARFEQSAGGHVLVNPTSVVAVVDRDVASGGSWGLVVHIDGGHNFYVNGDVQSTEDEINRALDATLQAQKDLASETSGKLEGLIAELKSKLEPTTEDLFRNNDLYPKGEN